MIDDPSPVSCCKNGYFTRKNSCSEGCPLFWGGTLQRVPRVSPINISFCSASLHALLQLTDGQKKGSQLMRQLSHLEFFFLFMTTFNKQSVNAIHSLPLHGTAFCNELQLHSKSRGEWVREWDICAFNGH